MCLSARACCVPVQACVCLCVSVCNWWGLDRDTGRPPMEVRDTLPGSCRLRKKYMHRSCQASYPLHLYLQNHYLRIIPSLRNKLDGHVCTATRMQTHCCMNITKCAVSWDHDYDNVFTNMVMQTDGEEDVLLSLMAFGVFWQVPLWLIVWVQ